MNFKFVLAIFLVLSGCAAPLQKAPIEYGVFVGVSAENRESIYGYQLVVIDAEYYTAEEVADLRNSGGRVYSYLNVGSIEKFRDCYDKYSIYSVKDYDGYPDERWMDVTRPEWKEYLFRAAAQLESKGVDGLFLDNCDVYFINPQEAVYQALTELISSCPLPVILNGGDVYVKRAIASGQLPNNVKGINQESVWTSFSGDTFLLQDTETTQYYTEYLSECSQAGLTVYLTEYASKSAPIRRKIKTFCKKNGYTFFVTDRIHLD
jgi:endo-alpha-1,4-polygalactosaminidase (GH114 family)